LDTYHQHKQIQGESAATSGYANADVAKPEDDLAEAATDAFFNLETATAVDHDIVAALTDDNCGLAKQLEESVTALKEIRAMLKKEGNDRAARKLFANYPDNYCWTHGYNIFNSHSSVNCRFLKNDHKHEATKNNNMGGHMQIRNAR
jgi:hypothetical protein